MNFVIYSNFPSYATVVNDDLNNWFSPFRVILVQRWYTNNPLKQEYVLQASNVRLTNQTYLYKDSQNTYYKVHYILNKNRLVLSNDHDSAKHYK